MIEKELLGKLQDAVTEIIDVGYTLQCLNDAAYYAAMGSDSSHFINITLSISQLMAKVLDNATNDIWDVIDAVKDAVPEWAIDEQVKQYRESQNLKGRRTK